MILSPDALHAWLPACRHVDVSSQRGNEAEIGAALLEVFSDWIVGRSDVWLTGKVCHCCTE